MGRLENLPDVLILAICEKLDARSLSSLDCSCSFLHTCVAPYLLQLPALHLLDTALPGKSLRRYMESNTTMRHLALDCGLLQKQDAMLLLKPHLQGLLLKNCFMLSDIGFEIAHCCINLRSLSLDFFWPEYANMIEHYVLELESLVSPLRFLESLSLRGQGRNLDASVLGSLPRMLGPSIKSLRIIHMEESDARQLANVTLIAAAERLNPSVRVGGCQSLERLSLVVSTITDALVSALTENLGCLTELDLEDDPAQLPQAGFDLTNWGFQQVAICKKLKRLSLVRGKPNVWSRGQSPSFRRVNDLGFLLMAQSCYNLESVRLGRFSQVTDTGLNSLLESCCRLRSFELIGMKKQTSDLTFHNMSACFHSMVVVSLPAADQITSEAAAQLACCSGLKLLNLAFCRSVEDRGLKALSYLSQLSILDLSGADITDFGLFSLSKTNSPLVSLSLRSCKRLTHVGICALMQGCLPAMLQALDLSNLPAVTDDTVMALVNSKMQIIDLRLRDCHAITDACVLALASMEHKGNCRGGSLEVLDLLNNVGVTPNALNLFQKPNFPRLQWLGLGRHLKSDSAVALLKEERGSVHLSFATSSDLDFGYDALTSRHADHWTEGEDGFGGTPFNERCQLCALDA